jgi:hypothetical protein
MQSMLPGIFPAIFNGGFLLFNSRFFDKHDKEIVPVL